MKALKGGPVSILAGILIVLGSGGFKSRSRWFYNDAKNILFLYF